MTDGDDENSPAKYTEADIIEQNTIDTINYIFDDRVIPYIDSLDKTPNHDNYIEITDENGEQTGVIWVQLKRLPEGTLDPPRKQFETRHLKYYQKVSDPFFLIVVDINNDVAYWHHVTRQWFRENELSNQDYKTVEFSEDSKIQRGENDYLQAWESIIKKNRDRIENFEEYEQLKRNSNPAIGVEKPEFENIHKFLDKFHKLLETDFEVISRNLYSSVWKFGFGSIDYSANHVEYTLYPIYISENDAQIRKIDDSWSAAHDLGSSRRIGVNKDNPIERVPEKYAYNVIEKEVSNAIKSRALDYSKSPVVASEYIYHFVNEYAPLLGLEQKDSYEVSEVRDGYYRYLQYWLSEELREYEQREDEILGIVGIRGYLDRDDSANERSHRFATEKMEEREGDPPVFNMAIPGFNQDVIERMINALVESSLDEISKPYLEQDFKLSNGEKPTSLLKRYSDEAILKNAEHYYSNFYSQLNHLAESNFGLLPVEFRGNRTNFFVVIIDMEKIRGEEDGSGFKSYWLKTDRDNLRVEVHRATDEEVASNVDRRRSEELHYDAEEYEIHSSTIGSVYVLQETLFQRLPLFSDVHEELMSMLKSYLVDKQAVTQHPEK